MVAENKVTGSNFSILCSKLAKSGHDLALAVEREKTAHNAFVNAVDTRNKVLKEYLRVEDHIDRMAGPCRECIGNPN
jgi:hypothetical protein